MTSLLARIDHHASIGSTPWHRASALGKLVVAAGVIGIAITSPSLMLLLVVHGIAWLLVASSRLPARVALTGRKAAPGIFEVMWLLGRERVGTRQTNMSQHSQCARAHQATALQ